MVHPGAHLQTVWVLATRNGITSMSEVTSAERNDRNTTQIPRVTERDVKIATWVCFFAWTFAVYDFVMFGNLLPKLAAELGWTSAKATGINTWVTVGTALVAFGIGPIVDKVGRRRGRSEE